MFDPNVESFESRGRGAHSVGLWFDSDRLMLEGIYLDEVTAYRARKRWIEALQTNFLLEEHHDFSMKVRACHGSPHFSVRCVFLTACGRYAFWRLTHHQAPEVQFLLETAHLTHISADTWREYESGSVAELAFSDTSPCRPEELYVSRTSGGFRRAAEVVRAMARRIFGRSKSCPQLHEGPDHRFS